MKTRDLVLTALFTALIAVTARIVIPLPTPVPFTIQVMMIALAGFVLGPWLGVVAVMFYVFLGLVGLPLFSFGGGLGSLAQPTFGFVLGFIPLAFCCGLGRGTGAPRFGRALLAGLTGLIPLYLLGVIWLKIHVESMSWAKAWSVGAAPFILFDAAKIALSAFVAQAALKALRARGNQ